MGHPSVLWPAQKSATPYPASLGVPPTPTLPPYRTPSLTGGTPTLGSGPVTPIDSPRCIGCPLRPSFGCLSLSLGVVASPAYGP